MGTSEGHHLYLRGGGGQEGSRLRVSMGAGSTAARRAACFQVSRALLRGAKKGAWPERCMVSLASVPTGARQQSKGRAAAPRYAARVEDECIEELFSGKLQPWASFRRDASFLVVPALSRQHAEEGAVSLQCRAGLCARLSESSDFK